MPFQTADESQPCWIDENHLDTQWLATHVNLKATSCLVKDMSNATRRGDTPREGATLLLTLSNEGDKDENSKRLVIKQVPSKGLPLSRKLGLAREALFYQHLAPRLPAAEAILPKIYYSVGDMTTGHKCLFMEDLEDWLDSGILFGPGNPNNWDRNLPQLISDAFQDRAPPSAATVAETTFCAIAHVHATFWK